MFTCLACKILALELETRLQETGKTREVLELGYSVDDVNKKKTEYRKSYVHLSIILFILYYNVFTVHLSQRLINDQL